MSFNKDDYVKVVVPGGDYRYGYILDTDEGGDHISVCFHDEGESKVEYDEMEANAEGLESPDWQAILTGRERQILHLLPLDLNNRAIASKIGISPVTVRGYIRSMLLKFNLATRFQLTVYAKGLELVHTSTIAS